MRRGWEVTLKDGTVLQENSTQWKDVPKNNIQTLALLYDGRRWEFSNKESYFITNRASMVPGVKESFQIEKRTIGYYEGASKVFYTIDEFSGEFKISVRG